MILAETKRRPNRRYILLVVIFVIMLYVIVPQLGDFQSSWYVLSHLIFKWMTLGIILTAFTYLAGATTYYLLSFKHLHYFELLMVQLAAMFINRLLPGGVGALGTNFAYLRTFKHSRIQAGTIVAVNNFLGLVGHILLVVGALLYLSNKNIRLPKYTLSVKFFVALSCITIVLLMMLSIMSRRKSLAKFIFGLRRQLQSYVRRPYHLLAALFSSMLLTLCNVLCLWACALAVGVELNVAVVMIVFSFGIGVGTATPTPGGLGGFEAGLVAGFLAYHVDAPSALAAALLYRLISYWLPLAVGAVAFVICERRKLFAAI